jgi:hypothetical protein
MKMQLSRICYEERNEGNTCNIRRGKGPIATKPTRKNQTSQNNYCLHRILYAEGLSTHMNVLLSELHEITKESTL